MLIDDNVLQTLLGNSKRPVKSQHSRRSKAVSIFIIYSTQKIVYRETKVFIQLVPG